MAKRNGNGWRRYLIGVLTTVVGFFLLTWGGWQTANVFAVDDRLDGLETNYAVIIEMLKGIKTDLASK